METSDVHVDLRQLGHLAARLDHTSRHLEGLARRLTTRGAGLGLEVTPHRRLREVAAWAEDRRRLIRFIVDEVQRLEATGALPPGMTVTRRRHGAFADPRRAHAAAREAAARLAAGSIADLRRAAELMRAHRGDPVFAATLLWRAGAAGVALALHGADRRWAQGRRDDRVLVRGLAAALAVALRTEVAPFGWDELAEHGGRRATGTRAVGLLFLTPAVFPTAALVGAVRRLVVPWNRAAARTPAVGSSIWGIAGPRGAVDVRAAVLRRVAADPAAARTVLATTEMDDLLPASLGYGDGGLAVAELVIAGTAPVDAVTGRPIEEPLVTGRRPAHTLSAANLRKVVGWMGRPRAVPVGVEMAVGRLLTPWVGSIRSPGLDVAVTRHAALDESAVRRVLGAGMRFSTVREHLGAAAWDWAGRESRRLAAGEVAGVGFDAIGSVVGIVAIEGQNGVAGRQAGRDLERDRQRTLWSQVQGLVSKPLPGAGRALVGALGAPLRGELLANTHHELVHWREHRDRAVGHDALALEYLVLATLWEERDANGYFSAPGGAPPASLLSGRPGRPRLRPLVGLDETAVAEYLAWRSRLADGRPAPVQLAAERLLAEGREVSGP
jgi:hypothetical protein